VSAHSAIEVQDLSVRRGKRRVLHRVSVAIEAGKITGLLGPSGSGKTTLLRAIAGVQIIESGTVRVLGEPAGAPTVRGRVGYTTQSRGLYEDLSARENLRYFGSVFLVSPRRITEALATVQLADSADRVVHTLSGGEQARVSLATALVSQPRVLILDEPTVGLDPVLRRDLWATFRRLADDGAALLVSSHVMDEADYCDELLLMRDGAILARGAPDELRELASTAHLAEAFLHLIESAQPSDHDPMARVSEAEPTP